MRSWVATLPATIPLVALLMISSGCSVIELERQTGTLDQHPVLHGDLQPENWGGEPLVLILSKDAPSGEPNLVEYQVMHDPGPFYFYVEPGTYAIAAFEDRSKGLHYQPGDPTYVYPAPIAATNAERRQRVDMTGRLSGKTELPGRFDISQDSANTTVSLALQNVGRVVPITAEEMSLELGQAGMWSPEEYLDEVEAGIFFLEPFDPDRIPVLFVHGIGGAPIQFETLAGALDPKRYQAWFFAYPSIFPLHMVAEALNAGMDILRRKHEFDRVHLIAHSMGGLVSRAYLNEYLWSRHDYEIDLFVSLASPFGGESGAAMYPGEDRAEPGPFDTWIANSRTPEGEHSHIAWTDMAPDSVFLTNLYAEPLPKGLPYYLIFAFDPSSRLGAPSDGTVTLESQLRPEAQREATGERGFAMGHDDVLSETAAVEYVTGILTRAGSSE